jgi:hypothetical protein
LLGLSYRAPNESLVPKMDSIEVAQCYDRSLQRQTWVTDVAINLHRPTTKFYESAQTGELTTQWEKSNSKSASNRLFTREILISASPAQPRAIADTFQPILAKPAGRLASLLVRQRRNPAVRALPEPFHSVDSASAPRHIQ